MIPFLVIGIVILTVGLTVGKLIFDIPIRGNLAVVFAYCLVFLLMQSSCHKPFTHSYLIGLATAVIVLSASNPECK